MADYWVSQPRHFCEACKCWLGGNKASIEFHERGKRHKECVEKQLRQARSRTTDKKKEDAETNRMLAAVELAAQQAYLTDLGIGSTEDTSSTEKNQTAKRERHFSKKPQQRGQTSQNTSRLETLSAPPTLRPSPVTPSTHTPYVPSPSVPTSYTPTPSTRTTYLPTPSTYTPYTPTPSTHTPSTHTPSTPTPSTHTPYTPSPSTPTPSTPSPYTPSPSTGTPSTPVTSANTAADGTALSQPAPPFAQSPWQQLTSPEGYAYYCNSVTGVSQWEYPAELAQQYYQAYGNETPTAAEGSSPEGAGHKQLGAGEGEGEGEREGGGEDGPPPPKRMARGVYGSWTTVAVRSQESAEKAEKEEEEEDEEEEKEEREDSDEEEEEEEEEKKDASSATDEPEDTKEGKKKKGKKKGKKGMSFREKKLPTSFSGAAESEAAGGPFKGFSFKKSSGPRRPINIRQRTSDLS